MLKIASNCSFQSRFRAETAYFVWNHCKRTYVKLHCIHFLIALKTVTNLFTFYLCSKVCSIPDFD